MESASASVLVIGTYWANVNWSDLSEWWISEVADDPAYAQVVNPLLMEILEPVPGALYLDVGCGEGRVMRELSTMGVVAHGLDINIDLARLAGVVMVANAVETPIRDHSYDGVYSVLTLEHLPNHGRFFAETARITKPGGTLAIVINHPVWTAPDATPITDQFGEVLWRPGDYFSSGITDMPAGEGIVTFHHRSMAGLLNAAADAGWSLERMIEHPDRDLVDQAGIPRLLACRWLRRT
jgi:SAM-dependent methyltransferase